MALPVDIRGVTDALGSSQVASGDLDLVDVALGDRTFAFARPASYEVTLTNTGSGIVGTGSVSAVARTQCVRCLCETDIEVTGEVQGFYVEPGHDAGIPDEQDVEYVADLSVDIEPAVVQALVLALPYAPVHSPDCRGLCPRCGADLNTDECGCTAESDSSPFAALKDLLTGPDSANGGRPSPDGE